MFLVAFDPPSGNLRGFFIQSGIDQLRVIKHILSTYGVLLFTAFLAFAMNSPNDSKLGKTFHPFMFADDGTEASDMV